MADTHFSFLLQNKKSVLWQDFLPQSSEPPHQVCISQDTVASHCPFVPSALGHLPLMADLLLCERFFSQLAICSLTACLVFIRVG